MMARRYPLMPAFGGKVRRFVELHSEKNLVRNLLLFLFSRFYHHSYMRYVLVPAPLQCGLLTLPKSEADHLRTVLRAGVGDAVGVLDGAGRIGTGVVQIVERKRVDIEVTAVEQQPASLASRIHIATAPPKGSRWDDLLRALTELGVGTIQPVQWRRSVRMPTKDDRAVRSTAEALKQCRRAWLPNCYQQLRLMKCKSRPGRDLPAAQVLLADPAGPSLTTLSLAAGPIVALIGPEGGVTDEERSAAVAAGAQPVCIAPHILRIETAAMAIAACLVAQTMEEGDCGL